MLFVLELGVTFYCGILKEEEMSMLFDGVVEIVKDQLKSEDKELLNVAKGVRSVLQKVLENIPTLITTFTVQYMKVTNTRFVRIMVNTCTKANHDHSHEEHQ